MKRQHTASGYVEGTLCPYCGSYTQQEILIPRRLRRCLNCDRQFLLRAAAPCQGCGKPIGHGSWKIQTCQACREAQNQKEKR